MFGNQPYVQVAFGKSERCRAEAPDRRECG